MRIAWVFPGQGSQSVGMGRELAEAFAAARRVFERADAALGEPISALCFDGPESELSLTRNTQPAIVTVSLAALAALEEAGAAKPPASAAGHSLGEYSALVAAGALELEDAVRLVRLRGEAMQAAVPKGSGAMAAILGLDAAQVLACCAEAAGGDVVSPANYNGPGQIVVAGDTGAVERAVQLATARGGKAKLLNVSAPFHCSLMAPAAARLAGALETIAVAPLVFPVFANADARPNQDAARVKELLVRQVDHPVRWEETVRAMARDGVTHLLEIGPGKVLGGLVKRIAKEMTVLPIGTPSGIEAAAALLG